MLGFESRSNLAKLCVSPDDKMLICVDCDGYGVFYNLKAHAVITHYNFHAKVTSISFSPDSKYFAVASEGAGKVRIYENPGLVRSFSPLVIYKKYTNIHSKDVTSIIWSPDSRFFMTVGNDMVCKILSLHALPGYEIISLTGFKKPVVLAFFSEVADRIFTLTKDGRLHIWLWT